MQRSRLQETLVETSYLILSAIYFITAIFLPHQCPPCRSLTRVLVESYRTIKESGQKFEIVFVSADRWAVLHSVIPDINDRSFQIHPVFCPVSCLTTRRSEESFKQYFSEMPWLAVPYSDEARRSRLNRLYGIQGGSRLLGFFHVQTT